MTNETKNETTTKQTTAEQFADWKAENPFEMSASAIPMRSDIGDGSSIAGQPHFCVTLKTKRGVVTFNYSGSVFSVQDYITKNARAFFSRNHNMHLLLMLSDYAPALRSRYFTIDELKKGIRKFYGGQWVDKHKEKELRNKIAIAAAPFVPPKEQDVLSCLASDWSDYVYSNSFECWADGLGYDTDSRKALATYEAMRSQSLSLERLFGRAAMESLASIEF
jgi:hypothetical protein